MFSNKENINILTSLLIAHGIENAIVCPGSRNAPIVHNLNECGNIQCWPVTDERSAGFYALGMAQATGKPVVVCVTSGSALLNLAPAVAEAHYQHIPLIVVSADRPQQWIGQLDGQTLPQPNALLPFVRKAVSLPEPHDDETHWLCNRLINEALFQAATHGFAPVHINVPTSEPLFCFDAPTLPHERMFRPIVHPYSLNLHTPLTDEIGKAEHPIIVIGQMPKDAINKTTMDALTSVFTVFSESLSNSSGKILHFDETIRRMTPETVLFPDLIIYVGNTLVSKMARRFLRYSQAKTYLITTDTNTTPDPTMHLEGVVECANNADIDGILQSLATTFESDDDFNRNIFKKLWDLQLINSEICARDFTPQFSQMATVKYLEEKISNIHTDIHTHYANSTAIRLANIYAKHYVWCNRGVNGIEGSVSTAAGFSLVSKGKVVCITGDLSFFYDQNALWNRNIDGRLRIVLLNNGGGGIFRQLNGLQESPAAEQLIEASHSTCAQGICQQNEIGYIPAHNMQEMQRGIDRLLTEEAARPILLEVFTDASADTTTMETYYQYKPDLHDGEDSYDYDEADDSMEY